MNRAQQKHKLRINHPTFSDYELDCVIKLASRRNIDPEDMTFCGPGPWNERGIEMTKEEYAAWGSHDKRHRYTVPAEGTTLRQTSRKRV